MTVAETESRTRIQGPQAEKADERKRRAGPDVGYANELEGESAVFEALLGSGAMELPLERHAALVADSRFGHRANAGHKALVVSQLQSGYGNGYVQRVLDAATVQASRRAGSNGGREKGEVGGRSDAGQRAPGLAARVHKKREEEEALDASAAGAAVERLDDRREAPKRTAVYEQPVITPQTERAVIARSPGEPGAETEEEELEELMEQAAPGELDLEELVESMGETTPTEEAEFRAGTPSGEWPALTPSQRTEIRNLIRTDRRPEAVERMWGMLPAGDLPEKGRVSATPTLTNTLGVIGGEAVFSGGALGSGLCIPYVVATSACVGCPESEHWQRHNAGELRAIIQVHNRVFERSPEEAVGQLLSTLMHEYTHVEQMVDEGLHEGIAFASYPPESRAAVGEREYMAFDPDAVTPAERRRMEGLQEIDATCSEIENAERTGLTGLGLQGIVSYLWTSYQRYCSNLEDNPRDIDVEDRAYRCIVRGRQLFAAFLAQTTMYTADQKQFLLDRCPEGYDRSLMSDRPLTGGTEGEEAEAESE